MDFISTRGGADAQAVSIDVALVAGLAADGGLYVPRDIPHLPLRRAGDTLADTAHAVLQPYFERVNTIPQIKHVEADPDFVRIRDKRRFKQMLAATKERLGISAVEPEMIAASPIPT